MFNNLATKPESEKSEDVLGLVDPGQMSVVTRHSQLLKLINNGEHTFVGWMVMD